MVASLVFLVLGMVLTFGGVAILAFDFYLTFDTGLKLLPVYDLILMLMGAEWMIDLQTMVQEKMGLEAWRGTIKPVLIMIPSCALIGLPGLLFVLIGIKSLPKKMPPGTHHMQ